MKDHSSKPQASLGKSSVITIHGDVSQAILWLPGREIHAIDAGEQLSADMIILLSKHSLAAGRHFESLSLSLSLLRGMEASFFFF